MSGSGGSMTGRGCERSVARRRPAMVLAATAALATGLSGCGAVRVVKAVNHSRENIESVRSTLDGFAKSLSTNAPSAFVVTYTTSGHSPATIRYAVRPPNQLAFSETPSRQAGSQAKGLHLIANPTGEYSCSGSTTRPSCQKLGTARAADLNGLVDIYTPAHYAALLKGVAVAAGLAGAHVGTSLKTVNGFALRCVFYQNPAGGRTTLCVTKAGVLGYTKLGSDPTTLRITSYSASPPASLFTLPPGARLTAAP
jgi:hypothetical protein